MCIHLVHMASDAEGPSNLLSLTHEDFFANNS
jgi:hypothetical protein